MGLDFTAMKDFLEAMTDRYNRPGFIENDPISIPHRFSKKEDIEIAGFLSATIAWGQRTSIIKNAMKLIEWMDHDPYRFILGFESADLKPFNNFVHRTFNGSDCIAFLNSLRQIYSMHGGPESLITPDATAPTIKESICRFRKVFFESPHESRTRKHLADPAKNASAKRLNMFLRWMVRDDGRGVDFGLWKKISPQQLMCPLDVHSGGMARKLGLLQRKQNDWKAVEELTATLQKFDPEDPVKFDFALFGLGINEGFANRA